MDKIVRKGDSITFYSSDKKVRVDNKDGTTFYSPDDESIKVATIGKDGVVLFDTDGINELMRMDKGKVVISDGDTLKVQMDYQYFQVFVSNVAKTVVQAGRMGLSAAGSTTKTVDMNAEDLTGPAKFNSDVDCPSGSTIQVLKSVTSS